VQQLSRSQGGEPPEAARTRRPLHWISQIPTPYNDKLFRRLAKEDDLALLVHYMNARLASHPWKTPLGEGYDWRIYCRRFGIDWHVVRCAVRERDGFMLLGGWHEPTVILVTILRALFGAPFAIWTDAPSPRAPARTTKQRLRERYLRWVFRRATAILGTGRMALANLQAMGCPSDKLVSLPYLADLDAFAFRRMELPNSTGVVVFLSCGRLVNVHKGYDLALRALAAAKIRLPGLRICYRIAGVGPDLEALRGLAQELGLKEEAEFLGWLEPTDTPKFYRSGHVFLHPAVFEPYGVAVIEAMAAGLIVIASDSTGAAVDRIYDGDNGFMFESGSVESLTASIVNACNARDRWPEISERAGTAGRSWTVEDSIGSVRAVMHMAKRG
jgi:glycosyltransferase involved in cell wall biosynthesis